MARIVAERIKDGKATRFVHLSALGSSSSSEIPYSRSTGLGEDAIKATMKQK